MLCLRSPNDLYVVVGLAQCVMFAALTASFDSFAGLSSVTEIAAFIGTPSEPVGMGDDVTGMRPRNRNLFE